MSSLDNLVVTPASDAQWNKTHEIQVSTWGAGLSADQFKRREHHLRYETDLGRQAFTAWTLTDKSDPDTLEFLSSCESFKRPIVIKYADGTVKEDCCQAIASVFTEESKRGRGYAMRMMQLMHDQHSQRAPMSVLYSDVGNYYARAKRAHQDPLRAVGWKIIGEDTVIWPIDQEFPETSNGPSVRLLSESDLASVCSKDVELVRSEVSKATGPAFAVLPTVEQPLWMIARCKYHDTVPGHLSHRHHLPRIDTWGVQLGMPDSPDWAFAYWSFSLDKGEMQILRLRCSSTNQLKDLLREAQKVGRKYGMKEISAWSVNPKLLENTGWQSHKRTGSLPALAWYGEGEEPRWLYNEHYAWC